MGRRVNAAAANVNTEVTMGHQVGGSRSMANRVVSFTHTAGFQENIPDQRSNMAARNQPSQENDGGGDSITMPDELDNFCAAESFSNSARAWREEYEARLDAIHKRLGN